MGRKAEEEQSLSTNTTTTVVDAQATDPNAENRCRARLRFVGFRCILALLLGLGVFLSALFWLPPFLNKGDQRDLDLDSQFGGAFARGSDNMFKLDVGLRASNYFVVIVRNV